ncbi:hypothetical protein [uncultured Pontibacter sp.]|uniref:hypothetical protein n=1 Tax=uncultured Pontibacter sp. TaxID=453356 RepID=UPI00260BF42C|nr:hypothetical protein [uncultured Pontibacter sp.]
MRGTLLIMLLLCSCATSREAESPVEDDAGKTFPPKFYPPAVYAPKPLDPTRLSLTPDLGRSPTPTYTNGYTREGKPRIEYKSRIITDTVYLQSPVAADSLSRELEIEQLANQAIRKRLQDTEADRDYWQEKNEQKFWALIAMGVFGFLYILFTLLASRIKET